MSSSLRGHLLEANISLSCFNAQLNFRAEIRRVCRVQCHREWPVSLMWPQPYPQNLAPSQWQERETVLRMKHSPLREDNNRSTCKGASCQHSICLSLYLCERTFDLLENCSLRCAGKWNLWKIVKLHNEFQEDGGLQHQACFNGVLVRLTCQDDS